MSNTLGIDLSEAVVRKLAKTARKYPVDQYRGRYRAADSPPGGCTKK